MSISQSHTPVISIHALHEESDIFAGTVSTGGSIISIHALHEESDLSLCSFLFVGGYFNPRSP